MLLTGTHPRTLDDKNRITLPKRVREQFGEVEQLFVTPGPDQCLWVFDQANLETLSAKLRIFRAPEFLGTAFLLAVLAMLVNLLLGG